MRFMLLFLIFYTSLSVAGVQKKVVHSCCLCKCGRLEQNCGNYCDKMLRKDDKGKYVPLADWQKESCKIECEKDKKK